MTLSLAKGANLSLTKSAPGLDSIRVGLGWDARASPGSPFDLDASALAVDEHGAVVGEQHFVFFNNLESPDGSIRHLGDNLTGEGEGDDETIEVDLSSLPFVTQRVVFTVSIYDADHRGQNFGQVHNAYIRVVNQADDSEITRYDLSEDASPETAMILGEVYRYGGDWKFRAIGQGYSDGLAAIVRDFGVDAV